MPLLSCTCMSADGPARLEHLDVVAFDLPCISRDCILPASFKLLPLIPGGSPTALIANGASAVAARA